MIAQIAERERSERIRQGYLVEGGQPSDQRRIAGRIQEPSFTPAPAVPESTSTVRPRSILPAQPQPETRDTAQSSTGGSGQTYSIPTPGRPDLEPQRPPADPITNNSREELRRLSEEDTKRRMAKSGVETETGKAEAPLGKKAGVEGVGLGGGGLAPRRRGR